MHLYKQMVLPAAVFCTLSFTACHSYRSEAELAIQARNLIQTQAILKGKGDKLTAEEKSALLYTACQTGTPEMVRLVCKELQPQVTKDCVAAAISDNSIPVLEVLFDYDKEQTQEFATEYLSWVSNAEMASLLLEHGCSPLGLRIASTRNPEVFKLYIRSIGINHIPTELMSRIILRTLEWNDADRLAFLLNEGLNVDAPYRITSPHDSADYTPREMSIREAIQQAPPTAYKCVFFFDEWLKKKK